LSAGDIALGYKQLMEVERAFRTLKTTLDLSPVYHRKDERIQAHVFLCFLALLLVRIAERKTGMTWDRIKYQMERLHPGEFFQKMDVFYKRRNRRRNSSTS
jgi:Transposase